MFFTKKDRENLNHIKFLLDGLMFADNTVVDGKVCHSLTRQFNKLNEAIAPKNKSKPKN